MKKSTFEKIGFIDEFINDVFKFFTKKRVECILLFGSYSAGFENPESDVDLWIVLKNYSLGDFIYLKNVYAKYRPLGLSLSVKWLDELKFKDESFASHKGNGHFLIWELQRSIVLYGKNPFSDIKIDKDLVYQSVVVKLEKILTEYRKFAIKGIKID